MAGVLVLSGCRSAVPVPPAAEDPGHQETAPLQQRLVVVVHGDASYLYHDRDGTAHQADVEVLKEVFAAARAMPQAEVFVFHQRPARRLLWLFPRDDGTFYHFRRGRLVREETYDQTRSAPLTAEARLIDESASETARKRGGDSLFTAALYYGHAVPERPVRGYHRSRPGAPFGIGALAQGLEGIARSLTPAARPFDALVLSTCDGGTPATVSALSPHARHLLASPGDLHLSFVDADLLAAAPASSGASSGPPPGAAWTRFLAQRAFDRLTERTVTAVTLATYHTRRAAPTARRLSRHAVPDTSASPTGARLTDCRRALDVPVDTAGVEVWYRPPQFGRNADQTTHSGWGCVQF